MGGDTRLVFPAFFLAPGFPSLFMQASETLSIQIPPRQTPGKENQSDV